MSLQLLGGVDGDLADLTTDLSSGLFILTEVGSGFFQLSKRLLRLDLPRVARPLDVIVKDRRRRERHLTNVAVRRTTVLRRGRVVCRARSTNVSSADVAVVVVVVMVMIVVVVATAVWRNISHVAVVVLMVAVVVVAILSIHAVAGVSFPRKISGIGNDGGNSADGGIGCGAQNGAGFRRFAVAGSAKARCQTRAHYPVLLLLLR